MKLSLRAPVGTSLASVVVGEPADDETPQLVVILYGQSMAGGHAGTGDSGGETALTGTYYFNDGTDTWDAASSTFGITAMMNSIRTGTGLTVGVINGAVGGQSIAQLAPGTAHFTALLAQINAASNRAHYVFLQHGENNAYAPADQATYLDAVDSIREGIADQVGKTAATLPLIIGMLGREANAGVDVTYDAGWTQMHKIQIAAETVLTNTLTSHSNQDATMLVGDNGVPSHWDGPSYTRSGRRVAETIKFKRGLTTQRPRFRIVSAAIIDGTTTDLTLEHGMGTDFTPTTGITRFEVWAVGSTTPVAATGARVSSTVLRLTHTDKGAGQRSVRCLDGRLASGPAVLKDNSSLAVPLFGTFGTPVVTS